jgi:endonuclease/exonuclease/phosphatase family metal-dependent hydrolase
MVRLRQQLSMVAAFTAALSPAATFRVASLNLEKKTGSELIRQIGSEADLRMADILLLQEVMDSPHFHVADEAAKALGLHVAFAKAFQWEGDTDEGIAVLSRYPISSRRVVPLARNALHFKNRIRIALVTEIAAPWGRTQVICTHLDNRINEDAKIEQLDGIWPAISRSGPAILGGDFNTGNFYWVSHIAPIPGAQHQLQRVLDDAKAHGFVTDLGSGPATYHIPGQRLDWIFVRDLKPTDSGVTPIHFSDHNSVWMTIQTP